MLGITNLPIKVNTFMPTRIQDLPPQSVFTGPHAEARMQFRLKRACDGAGKEDTFESLAAELAAPIEAESEKIKEMRETARDGSRLNFSSKKNFDHETYGSDLAGRTIGPDE